MSASSVSREALERLASLDARSVDFFQLARTLECAFRDLPRLGTSQKPGEDPVRFAQEPSTAFAPTTVSKIESIAGARAGRVFVNFLGMLGPNGPMPLFMTDYARDRERNHADATLARFLDVFNHRMVSLFYRAWAVNQLPVSFDRTHGQSDAITQMEEDRYGAYIGSLFGIGMATLRGRDRVPDVAKLHYSGRLSNDTKHAEGLRAIIEDYFRVQTRLDEFVGAWLELPSASLCRLGVSRDSATLGVSSVLGSRVWECQSRFRIVLGPMGLSDYERLLPGGDSQGRLEDWVRNYVGRQFSFEVNLILRREEVPRVKLGGFGRLGWTTWLFGDSKGGGDLGRNARDLALVRDP